MRNLSRYIFALFFSVFILAVFTKADALYFAQDGEDGKLQSQIQSQKEEKRAIAVKIQAERDKDMAQNALLVEQIKKKQQVIEKKAVPGKKSVVINAAAFIIAGVFFIILYAIKYIKRRFK